MDKERLKGVCVRTCEGYSTPAGSYGGYRGKAACVMCVYVYVPDTVEAHSCVDNSEIH